MAPISSGGGAPPQGSKGVQGSVVEREVSRCMGRQMLNLTSAGTVCMSSRSHRSQPSSPMTRPVSGDAYIRPLSGDLHHDLHQHIRAPRDATLRRSSTPDDLQSGPIQSGSIQHLNRGGGGGGGGKLESDWKRCDERASDTYISPHISGDIHHLSGGRRGSNPSPCSPCSTPLSMARNPATHRLVDMTHTQRGGLLMHHHKSTYPSHHAVGVGGGWSAMRAVGNVAGVCAASVGVGGVGLRERERERESREVAHSMKELRLQNAHLKEQNTKLVDTGAVEEVASLLEVELEKGVSLQTDGPATSNASATSNAPATATSNTSAAATASTMQREPSIVEGRADAIDAGATPAGTAGAAGAAGTAGASGAAGAGSGTGGAEYNSNMALPQPWVCITATLQRLGRHLMYSMLDQDIAEFVLRIKRRVTKLDRYRACALSKVQTAAASLWPRAHCKIFGSVATGLSVPSSDVDIIVCLPKVLSRESEVSLARAGVMQGRHVIKSTLQANLAQFLQNADWVQSDSVKTFDSAVVPVIQLTTRQLAEFAQSPQSIPEGPPAERDCANSLHYAAVAAEAAGAAEVAGAQLVDKADSCVKIDVTFEGPDHRGLAAVSLVSGLLQDFPALEPLFLVVKTILSEKSLDNPYTGGLSSFGLVLLLTRFLQHVNVMHAQGDGGANSPAAAAAAAPAAAASLSGTGAPGVTPAPAAASSRVSENIAGLGELLSGFLDFIGNRFDPRVTGISIGIGSHAASSSSSHSAVAARQLGGRFLRRDQPLTVATASEDAEKSSLHSASDKDKESESCHPTTANTPFQRSNSAANRRNANMGIERAENSAEAREREAVSGTGGGVTGGGVSGAESFDKMTAQERRYRLDPLYIENPLAPQTNVTRNCFRIYRIQRLLSDSLVNLRNAVLAEKPSASGGAVQRASASVGGGAYVSIRHDVAHAPCRILHAILSSPDLI